MAPKRIALSLLVVLPEALAAQHSPEHMESPTLVMTSFDELEIVDVSSDTHVAWDADVWAGTDLRRLWIKTEGETADDGRDQSELQLLYSRAILPFWDVQGGVRRDIEPAGRNGGVVAIRGIAPYHFDTEAELFLAEGGDASLRVHASYELLLTQRWIVEPEVEVLVNGYDDAAHGVGSGLSRAELGVRLRYELRREVAPYVGLQWTQRYGDTRDHAQTLDLDDDELALVAGIRVWF